MRRHFVLSPGKKTMTHTLILLLELLTNSQAVAALVRDLLTFGAANTAFACLFGSLEIVRRTRLRPNQIAFSRV
jgi:hypothetical protein